MFTFIYDNLGTIVVTALIIAAVMIVVRKLIKDRQSGKGCTGCSGNCAECNQHVKKK